jgi:hypothetical protein
MERPVDDGERQMIDQWAPATVRGGTNRES